MNGGSCKGYKSHAMDCLLATDFKVGSSLHSLVEGIWLKRSQEVLKNEQDQLNLIRSANMLSVQLYFMRSPLRPQSKIGFLQ